MPIRYSTSMKAEGQHKAHFEDLSTGIKELDHPIGLNVIKWPRGVKAWPIHLLQKKIKSDQHIQLYVRWLGKLDISTNII
jgi:hypothetical protein